MKTIQITMIEPATKLYTSEEYLALERESFEKHEYYKGEIFAMAGAGFNHNRLQKNFIIEVGSFLKGKSCDIFGSDLRIHVPATTFYTYPDAAIVCGKLESYDENFDIALNPIVIVEVLSPSTKSYDRGEKFMLYRSIKTLQEYILIDSLSVKVEHHTKQSNNTWLLQEFSLMEDVLFISSIHYSFALSELYEGVEW